MRPPPFSSLPSEIQVLYGLFTPRRLKKTDLRSLTRREIDDWMPEMVGYVDSDTDFKELLPRFFELVWQQAEAGGTVDLFPACTLGLGSDCVSWPTYHREAVQACFVLLWRLALENKDSMGMSEILEFLQAMRFSWSPFLEKWFQSSVSTSVLADAISLRQWDDLPVEARQWLCQKAIFERIQTDFFAAQDDKAYATISEFEEQLSFYCTR